MSSVNIAMMLVGLPGAGKTTWATKYMQNSDQDFVRVSSDDIIERGAYERGQTYDETFAEMSKSAFEEFEDSLRYFASEGRNLIIDQTNT